MVRSEATAASRAGKRRLAYAEVDVVTRTAAAAGAQGVGSLSWSKEGLLSRA